MSIVDVLDGGRSWWIECADVMAGLARLPDGAVQTVVTSVPYYGLRDYGTATWVGGDDSACDHRQSNADRDHSNGVLLGTRGERGGNAARSTPYKGRCNRCGAARVDQQLGLEGSPDEYLAKMVAVFREVQRVLRPDGTVWLNCGDSYGSGTRTTRDYSKTTKHGYWNNPAISQRIPSPAKQLMGMPFRLALALQQDGWYWRSCIPWLKRSAMPESVTDRPSTAVEYVFLLSKSSRYFYDGDGGRVAYTAACLSRYKTPIQGTAPASQQPNGDTGRREAEKRIRTPNLAGRARRNADWFFESFDGLLLDDLGDPLAMVVNPQPFKESHFAVFPERLVEPLIRLGTSERGCCSRCGVPWRRDTKVLGPSRRDIFKERGGAGYVDAHASPQALNHAGHRGGHPRLIRTLGWEPTCRCEDAGEPVSCLVLDPFAGAGTTLLVARRLGRRAIGIDLSPAYCEMARDRIIADQGVEPGHADEVAWPAQLRMLA